MYNFTCVFCCASCAITNTLIIIKKFIKKKAIHNLSECVTTFSIFLQNELTM
jgi:hypothetical protein